MRKQIDNPYGRPTHVGEVRVGKAFAPEPVNPNNTLHGIGGPETDEYTRLSIFFRDLNRCRRWMEQAYKAKDEDERDALHIAALLTFMTCFQSTSGHRVRPLKMRKILAPEQRQIFESLRTLRNRYVAHDEQDVPVNAIAIELNDDAVAEYAASAIGFIPLHGWSVFDKFAEILDVVHRWVAEKRGDASSVLIASFNLLPEAERFEFKQSPRFVVSLENEPHIE